MQQIEERTKLIWIVWSVCTEGARTPVRPYLPTGIVSDQLQTAARQRYGAPTGLADPQMPPQMATAILTIGENPFVAMPVPSLVLALSVL